MSLPVKLGVGTLALGSAVGVGYGAVNYFWQENKDEPQKTSVKDLINKKYEYILLNTSKEGNNPDKDHWANIWKDYEKKVGNEVNPLQLDGWATRNSANFTDKIKEKCSRLANSMIINEEAPDYKDVTKYCARGVTLADETIKDGLEIIPTTDGTNDNTNWEPKVTKKQNLTEQLKKLGLNDDASLTAKNVREKCKDIATKKKQDSGYQDTLPAYKEVCANQKAAK